MMRETFEIEIRNRSEDEVTVKVIEQLYRWSNWVIAEHNSDYEKTDAQTIEFPVNVAPGATHTVRYTVEYNW